jgi:nicotinamidase-related amidase
VICGVSTAWAIQAAVREGHDRDYSIVLIEDACAAANEEEHQQCIHQLSRICKVIKVKELNSLS